jgi:hypothetical protein
MVHSGHEYTLKRDQDDKAVAKDIIVQGAQELGREKWRETPLAE